MKRLSVIILSIVIPIVINGQTIFTITNSGNTFTPADVTVNQGDIVRFAVGTFHPVLQVDDVTWAANGGTALSGGFSFPTGNGDYTASTPGTFYYICTRHIGVGMKGRIIVNMTTGIDDGQIKNADKVFPNPATNYIIYQTANDLSIKEIRILDIIGKTVKILPEPDFSNGQVRIDIDNLAKGIYFILLKSEHGTVSKRFLKS